MLNDDLRIRTHIRGQTVKADGTDIDGWADNTNSNKIGPTRSAPIFEEGGGLKAIFENMITFNERLYILRTIVTFWGDGVMAIAYSREKIDSGQPGDGPKDDPIITDNEGFPPVTEFDLIPQIDASIFGEA
jgi:hypothetical protein